MTETSNKQRTGSKDVLKTQSEFTTNDLCERCAGIDFESAQLSRFDNKYRDSAEWKPNSCPFCALLMKDVPLEPGYIDMRNFGRYEGSTYGEEDAYKPLFLRGVVVTQYTTKAGNAVGPLVAIQPKPDTPLRPVTPLTDFDSPRSWIRFCIDNHSGACHQSEDTRANIRSEVPSLRFLDCRTRKIIPALETNEPYAALSYLWGNTGHQEHTSNGLGHLPATIEDAVCVTSNLGLRYLWIDRYCINQLSEEDKSSQVGKMDLIYNSAYITIVAAAGSDPNYGLPGVSRSRCPGSSVKIGRQYCMQIEEYPFRSIRESRWWTRGWTYQEGVLSRRRLIFTESRIYYECPGMYYWEQLNVPLRELHTEDQSSFQDWLCSEVNIGIFPRELGKTPQDITNRISEYSRRNLTKSADALNAFRGILRACEIERKYHYLGVPILHDHERFPEEFSPITGFCQGLLWWPINSQPDTEPYNGRPVRRLGFPSWSWTGWSAHIAWGFWESHAYTCPVKAHVEIQVEHREGHFVQFDTFVQEHYDRSSEWLDTLHIQAWTSMISTSTINALCREEHPNYNGRIDLSQQAVHLYLHTDKDFLWHCDLDRKPSPEPSKCYAVYLLQNLENMEGHWLIVQEVEAGMFERIGLARSVENGLPRPPVVWKDFCLR